MESKENDNVISFVEYKRWKNEDLIFKSQKVFKTDKVASLEKHRRKQLRKQRRKQRVERWKVFGDNLCPCHIPVAKTLVSIVVTVVFLCVAMFVLLWSRGVSLPFYITGGISLLAFGQSTYLIVKAGKSKTPHQKECLLFAASPPPKKQA